MPGAVTASMPQFALGYEAGVKLGQDASAAVMSAAKAFREIRSRLLALPARLGGKLPFLTAQELAIVDAEIRDCLIGLADPSTYPPVDVPD